MADEKPKGSLLYEILIVVLAAVLIISIIYPKKVSDTEEANTELCRHRMSEIFSAELQYLKYNKTFNDTLDNVIEFLRTDSSYASYVDSVIAGGLDSVITLLGEFKTREGQILALIPSAGDTTMIDSISTLQQKMKYQARALAGLVEFIHDRMKNLPNTPIDELKSAFLKVDSKEFTLDMDIVKNFVESGQLEKAQIAAGNIITDMDEVTGQFQSVLDHVPEYKGGALDSLRYCPTVHKPFTLAHVDTGVFKYLNIFCPIDRRDIEVVEGSFFKSTVGGLELVNHGCIESGENVAKVNLRISKDAIGSALETYGLKELVREADYESRIINSIGRTEFFSKRDLSQHLDQLAQSDSVLAKLKPWFLKRAEAIPWERN